MTTEKFVALGIVAVALIACSANKPTEGTPGTDSTTNKTTTSMSKNNKEKVVELLKAIETGATEPIAYINPNQYTQHNLAAADGLAGFGALLKALPPNSAKVKTVRAFQDGNYVFTHTEYNFFGPKIGFDIFRFEDGLIVEHWDNLQETPKHPNPSGHTMIDGPATVIDTDKTEENKK